MLAFDTTTALLSFAFQHQGQLFQHAELAPSEHAKKFLPTLEALLQQAHLKLSDFNTLVVTQGPGTFTGVRTGISMAQGLALGTSLSVLGFSSLIALAEKAYRLTGATRVLTTLDARQQALYWAAFERNAVGQWKSHLPEALVLPNTAPLPLWDTSYAIIGTGIHPYESLLKARLPAHTVFIDNPYPEAQDVLSLAIRSTDKPMAPALLMPVYHRLPV